MDGKRPNGMKYIQGTNEWWASSSLHPCIKRRLIRRSAHSIHEPTLYGTSASQGRISQWFLFERRRRKARGIAIRRALRIPRFIAWFFPALLIPCEVSRDLTAAILNGGRGISLRGGRGGGIRCDSRLTYKETLLEIWKIRRSGIRVRQSPLACFLSLFLWPLSQLKFGCSLATGV
jgi:hypothetical protein